VEIQSDKITTRKGNFFSLPMFLDPDKNRTANLINLFSLILFTTGLVGLVVFPFLGLHAGAGFWGAVFLMGLGAGTQILLRYGHIETSRYFLIILGWVGTGVLVFQFGGLQSPFILLYVLFTIAAGLIINARSAILISILSTFASLGFVISEINGTLTPAEIPLQAVWIFFSFLLITTAALLARAIWLFQINTENIHENERKLAEHNYELQEQMAILNRRVTDRTAEVSEYLLYLQTSTELSQAINTNPESGQLMQEFVDLLQKRFGLYYVGLFLVDQSEKWAVLQVGTGETGKLMVSRQHKIEIGSGMVGWCIANARARSAADAGNDAVRLATPELPHTRSEAAIPIRSLGKVIGALSLQSIRTNSFSTEMMTVLQNYADILGTVLDNLQLNKDVLTLQETEVLTRKDRERTAWVNTFGGRGGQGLLYDRMSITPIYQKSNPDIQKVYTTTQVVSQQENDTPVAFVPVQVREQVIGVLTFRKKLHDPLWTQAEVSLLQQLADQLASALDNARLYQSIQSQAAREQLMAEVTSRMRETLDTDTVLRTAAEEIYHSLQLEHVAIELVTGDLSPTG
jgi:GAF domain-containing protein